MYVLRMWLSVEYRVCELSNEVPMCDRKQSELIGLVQNNRQPQKKNLFLEHMERFYFEIFIYLQMITILIDRRHLCIEYNKEINAALKIDNRSKRRTKKCESECQIHHNTTTINLKMSYHE